MSTRRKQKIFVHNTTEHMGPGEAERCTGMTHRPARALWLSEPGDIIVLHPDLQPSWEWIQAHARRVGIPVTGEVLWDTREFDVVPEYPDHELDVFFFGRSAHRVRPDQRRFDVTAEMNNKNEFVRRARELGIEIPETWCFGSKAELGDTSDFPFPVRVKMAVSATGMGVSNACHDRDELEAALAQVPDDLPFQIQVEIADAIDFANVAYTANGGLARGIITGQVLRGNSHNGNRYPVTYEQAWATTDPIALWMWQQGVHGTFAIDVAVTRDGKSKPIDPNPRVNGTTYPTTIANRLRVPAWRAEGVQTGVRCLANVELGELEFSPRTGRGVVIFNWGSVCDGTVGIFAAAPTEAEQRRLVGRTAELLA